jgi:hypothetical protein
MEVTDSLLSAEHGTQYEESRRMEMRRVEEIKER